jgi:hypothetical protein
MTGSGTGGIVNLVLFNSSEILHLQLHEFGDECMTKLLGVVILFCSCEVGCGRV